VAKTEEDGAVAGKVLTAVWVEWEGGRKVAEWPHERLGALAGEDGSDW